MTIAYASASARSIDSYWTIPVHGGRPTKLADANAVFIRGGTIAGPATLIDWAPDGKNVALVDRDRADGPNRIFLLDVSSRVRRALTTPPSDAFGDMSPAFSPDGKRLAYVRRFSSYASEIRVIEVQVGDGPERASSKIEFVEGNPRHVDWAPNGKSLVVGAAGMTWFQPLEAGEAVSLLANSEIFSVSREGAKLAFVNRRRVANIWSIPGPDAPGESWSQRPQIWIESSMWDSDSSLSPGGSRVAFQSNRTGTEAVWVSDADGLNASPLTRIGGSYPVWSPDGKTIAFFSSAGGSQTDIYLVDAEGGATRPFTQDPAADVHPTFSPDGRWIYFGSERSGDSQIWKKPVEGGVAVQVTFDGGRLAHVDDQYVYYSKIIGVNGIWRMPLEGGEPSKVIDQGRHQHWDLWNDYLCVRRRNPPEVTCYSTVTGELVLSRILDEGIRFATRGFSISPDGQSILLTLYDTDEADIMIAEGLRFE